MPPWEVNYAEGVDEDFTSEKELMRVKDKMDIVSLNPIYYSKSIKNTPANLRTIRFGDFRLFILLNQNTETIHCLAYLPRKHCYDKKSINKVLTRVKRDFS